MNKNNGTKHDMNLIKLVERFHSEERCRDYLEKLRWPDGITCPRCQSKSVSEIRERSQYDCNSCRYQFSVTSGTIFHDSHLPLWKWFLTAYMMIESRKGVSANQIKRTIEVSYKTAWYLCHRIREAMTVDNPIPLSKIVEVDETWVGGKRKNVGHGYKGNKVVVAGAAQRNGEARLEVIDDRTREVLHQFIKKHIAPDAEAIYTDDWPAYDGIADKDTRHETVNHSAEEWVRGDVHTNYVENIWSLLKRSLVGSYHKVSKKHLDAYLDELEWRFNNRDNPYLFRDTLLKLIKSENLTYKKLKA
jgi:transposase-like protein